jgi:hypothetical protein
MILEQVIDEVGVERRGASDKAVHLVTLVQQELGQVRTVLSSNSSYEGFFHADSSFQHLNLQYKSAISGEAKDQ